MKKVIALATALCVLISMLVISTFAVSADNLVDGDFTATVTVTRDANTGSSWAGIMFYASSTPTSANWDDVFYFAGVRFDAGNPARVDLVLEKQCEGSTWGGFLIAEEYQATQKDCFVSVDDGWDATTDNSCTLTVSVKGTMATVTMTGNTTGRTVTMHYDLTKGGPAGGEGNNVAVYSKGQVVAASWGGTVSDLQFSNNLKAHTTVTRAADGALRAGIIFYANPTATNPAWDDTFYVAFIESAADNQARADLVMEKQCEGGTWGGFLIAEEYQDIQKDRFVSVDDGWDATADTQFDLTVEVIDGVAAVTMTGKTTGKTVTLNYDLGKIGAYSGEGENFVEYTSGRVLPIAWNGTCGHLNLGTATVPEEDDGIDYDNLITEAPTGIELPQMDMLGAAVRGESDIRFGIELNVKDWGVDLDAVEEVRYGTLFLPTETLGENELTLATADVLDVPTTKWQENLPGYEGRVLYTGVLTDIPSADEEITARGYMLYSVGGEWYVLYSAQISRSINGVYAAVEG